MKPAQLAPTSGDGGDTGADPMWTPFTHRALRWIWVASLVSNIGTWMQTVGAQWLLVDQSASPVVISLVQTASALPVLLLTLPAGVIAEFTDRRRMLFLTQILQLVVGVLLALLTAMDMIGPTLLLTFTFLLGCGTAAQVPALQAYLPDLVDRRELGSAASLGAISINLARAVGPAVAGALIPLTGVVGVFAVNAASFSLFAVILLRSPAPTRGPRRRQSFVAALEGGARYVRHSLYVRRILLRLTLFAFPASIMWALLAPVAQDRLGLGAAGYGLMLGAAGGGSVVGALFLPRVTRRWGPSAVVAASGVLTGLAMAAVGGARSVVLVLPALALAGVGWILVVAGTSAAVQQFLPDWVRARALAVLQLVLFGNMAGGAVVWGTLATLIGLGPTFLTAGAVLVLGAATIVRWPLLSRPAGAGETSSGTWVPPEASLTPEATSAPLRVIIAYRVDPVNREAFLELSRLLRHSRHRTGALAWSLFESTDDPGVLTEEYTMGSWDELVEQGEHRTTGADQEIIDRVGATARAVAPPVLQAIVSV